MIRGCPSWPCHRSLLPLPVTWTARSPAEPAPPPPLSFSPRAPALPSFLHSSPPCPPIDFPQIACRVEKMLAVSSEGSCDGGAIAIIGSCRCVYVCDLLVKKLVRVSYRTPYVVCGHIGNTGRSQCSANIERTCISTSVNTQAVSSTSPSEDYDRESFAIPDRTYSVLEAV